MQTEGGLAEMDSHPGGGEESGLRLVSCQCFLALPGSPWQCHLLKAAGQRGWGQPEPWTGGLRVVFGVILFYFLQILVQA